MIFKQIWAILKTGYFPVFTKDRENLVWLLLGISNIWPSAVQAKENPKQVSKKKKKKEYFLCLAVLILTSQLRVATECTSLRSRLPAPRSRSQHVLGLYAGDCLSVQLRNPCAKSCGQYWEHRGRAAWSALGQQRKEGQMAPKTLKVDVCTRNELVFRLQVILGQALSACIYGQMMFGCLVIISPFFRDSDSVGCLLGWTRVDLERSSQNKTQSGAF